jgi:hypothetical protein
MSLAISESAYPSFSQLLAGNRDSLAAAELPPRDSLSAVGALILLQLCRVSEQRGSCKSSLILAEQNGQ